MSCCDRSPAGERIPGKGCCGAGTSCAGQKTGCTASEPRIRTCLCQTNVGCLDRPDCGGFRPRGTAETGACPGPCQCEVEDSWNRNVPPKPNCEWVSNFTELRRQWSDHSKRESCKCCNCRPSRPSTPCRPCLPCPPPAASPCCSSTSVSCQRRDQSSFKNCCESSRLAGGACQPCCGSPSPSGCCPSPPKSCCSPPSCGPSSGCCPPDPCDPGRSLSGSCPPAANCCPRPCSPPPSSCQPCAPQPRPILKKRSCCLCAPGSCMCQPMPRKCNCPPPVQIDARADEECSCDCPSSPECACPPSERRFSRSKVRCQNARMCCPLPRLPPGPPCCCTECRPCLPPPCDPCSSSRCCSPKPKFTFCRPASPCPPPRSPCRPKNCRPSPSCSPCRKPAPVSPCRSLARSSSSRGSSCCSPCRAPGQSSSSCDRNAEGEPGERGDHGNMVETQCRCGADGNGCADDCDWCCSQNCADAGANDSASSGTAKSENPPSITEISTPDRTPAGNSAPAITDKPNTPAGNAAATTPRGSNVLSGSRRNRPPVSGRVAVNPASVRVAASPTNSRTPVGTNAPNSRIAVKRANTPLKTAPRRPGLGPRASHAK